MKNQIDGIANETEEVAPLRRSPRKPIMSAQVVIPARGFGSKRRPSLGLAADETEVDAIAAAEDEVEGESCLC